MRVIAPAVVLGVCPLLACGADSDALSPNAALRPLEVAALELPVRSFDASPGGAGLAVAHDPALGDLLGGPRGLFVARGDTLQALDPVPVRGLTMAAPSAAAVATPTGLSVFDGALSPSPLSPALAGETSSALAGDAHGLWIATDAGLHRYAGGVRTRFDDFGPLDGVHLGGAPLTAHGPQGVFHIAPDGEGWRYVTLSDERPLDEAFILPDGSALGLHEGALWRRTSTPEGAFEWRPQALTLDGPAAQGVGAAAQDPRRGVVWLWDGRAVHRFDGARVATQALPTGSADGLDLAVDELGALWIDDGAQTTRIGEDTAPVTWRGEVAAFSEANCARCHGALGTARPLEGYETWRADIDLIVEAVEAGRMPLDRAALTRGSLNTLKRWKEDGLQF